MQLKNTERMKIHKLNNSQVMQLMLTMWAKTQMSESSDNGLYLINSAKDDAVKWMKYINRRYQNRTKNQRQSRWVC